MLVRNVSTDIRSRWGGGTEEDGNSIFVFEAEGLCIAHLGHLHHEPTDRQYAALGRADVLIVPVDGGYTLPLDTVLRVVERLKSLRCHPDALVLRPGAGPVPRRVVGNLRSGPHRRAVDRGVAAHLPSRPTVKVLRPQWLRDEG